MKQVSKMRGRTDLSQRQAMYAPNQSRGASQSWSRMAIAVVVSSAPATKPEA
jgi:hypothetical protein